MQKIGKDHACGSRNQISSSRTDRQTDTHTHTQSGAHYNYFATALAGEVTTVCQCHALILILMRICKFDSNLRSYVT